MSNNKLESLPIPFLHFSLHYMPQLSPFMESLLDQSSSSSSSSGSPPSSCMTSPQAMTTGSSPESPPFLHHAFYLNRLSSGQQMSGSSSSLGPPSCQFLSSSYSPVLYPSQPQFPGPMYPVTNMSSAQGGLWRTFIRYNPEFRHLYIQRHFRDRGMLDYDELCTGQHLFIKDISAFKQRLFSSSPGISPLCMTSHPRPMCPMTVMINTQDWRCRA